MTAALEKAHGYQGDNMNLPVRDEEPFAEFQAHGLNKEISAFTIEQHGGVAWRVFYVVSKSVRFELKR